MPQAQPTAAALSRHGRQQKSEGRPRLDATAAKLSEDRRIQIRRAQKTYRLKKDACIQKSQQRVSELEHKLTTISELLREHHNMLEHTLQGSHPELLGGCERILELSTSVPDGHQADSILNPSAQIDQVILSEKSSPMEGFLNANRENPMSGAVGRSIGTQVNYTYSFLETSFERRLKRCSLEYAFRIFNDPHSDPHEVFRLFRLVPCFRERAKMYPYFKSLVTSGRDHSLEISSLPLYAIGGAGTHYADLDNAGNPIYPSNMRVPRRILGILPLSQENDPSKDFSQTQQSQLELCGFGGDWFDCRDVEGYLKARGVQLDESTVFPTVMYTDSGPRPSSRQTLQNQTLDVELFIEQLRSCMAILGRAPGFRRSDVDIAFQAALKI